MRVQRRCQGGRNLNVGEWGEEYYWAVFFFFVNFRKNEKKIFFSVTSRLYS